MATMGKRKQREGPRKLTKFFSSVPCRPIQDGPDAGNHTIPSSAAHSHPCSRNGESPDTGNPTPSSASNSPIKQRRRLNTPDEAPEQDVPEGEDMDQSTACHKQLDAYPTAGIPITDTTMKDMLLTLRGAIQQDITCFMRATRKDIAELGQRIDYVENKMGDFTAAHNELVDAHFEVEEELKMLRLKISDIEDRNRRNNIKFRGIPEAVKPADLTPFLQQLMVKIIPSLTPADLIIDRAHRLPKPSHLPEKVPRDVIVRIHFYHVKDQLMRFSKQHQSLPDPYAGITLFTDLSQITLAARNSLIPITKILRNHKILYKWGFPAKLLLNMQNQSYSISSLEKGLELLRKWNLLPAEQPQSSPAPLPPREGSKHHHSNKGPRPTQPPYNTAAPQQST